MKKRLLKRFSQWEESSEDNFDEVDTSTLMDSIKDDLEKLYNTKRGTVLIDEDFGLPDFSYMLSGYTAPDVGLIMQQIHLQAKQYEPRLHALHVAYVEQNKFPGKMQFQITAKMKVKDNDLPFNVYALLGGDGSVSINS